MSKIIRLTESDLIRIVKRALKEQDGPWAPGMKPKSSSEPTPRGVNPSLPKPKLEPVLPKNPEWTKLKDELISSGFNFYDKSDDMGTYQFLKTSNLRVSYADSWNNGKTVSFYSPHHHREVLKKLPKDIKTNLCYFDYNGKPTLSIDGSLMFKVRLSCKKEIKNLISILK
jgi:hypothetical protein